MKNALWALSYFRRASHPVKDDQKKIAKKILFSGNIHIFPRMPTHSSTTSPMITYIWLLYKASSISTKMQLIFAHSLHMFARYRNLFFSKQINMVRVNILLFILLLLLRLCLNHNVSTHIPHYFKQRISYLSIHPHPPIF